MIGDDDLDPCFSTDEFAQAGEISNGVDDTLTVNGYFTQGTDATVLYGVAVEAVKPSFITKTGWITAVRRGDTFRTKNAIGEWLYFTIERIEHTGTGVSTLYLKTTSLLD